MAIVLNSSAFNGVGSTSIGGTCDYAANSVTVALVSTFSNTEYMPITTVIESDQYRPRNWQRKYYRQFFDPNNSGQYVTQEVWWCYNEVARGSMEVQFQSESGKLTQQKGAWIGNFTGIFDIDDPFDPNAGSPFLTEWPGSSSAPAQTITTTDPSTMVVNFLISLQIYTNPVAPADTTWVERARRSLDWRSQSVYTKAVSAAGDNVITYGANHTNWHLMGFALIESAPPVATLTYSPVSQNSTSNGTAYVYGDVPAGATILAFVTTVGSAEFLPIATTGQPSNSGNTGLVWAKKYSKQFLSTENNQYIVQEVWWAYTATARSGVQLDMQVAAGKTTVAKGIHMGYVLGVTDTANPWDDDPLAPGSAENNASSVPYAPLNTTATETLAFGFFVGTKAYTGLSAGDGWTGRASFSMDYRTFMLETNNLAAPAVGSRALTYQGPYNGWSGLTVAIKAGAGAAPELHLEADLVDETVIDVEVTITLSPVDVFLEADLVDETVISVVATIDHVDTTPPVLLKALLRDETVIAVAVTIGARNIHPVVHLVDESVISIELTTHAPYPKYNLVAHMVDESVIGLKPPAVYPLGGPIYFAWAGEGAIFSSGVHGFVEEDVFSFTISQEEGDFAKLQVVLRNPKVGLLSVGRQRWAFLSLKHEGVVVPQFYGRLVGIPTNIFEELVTLDFIARPFDFVDRKKALADTLRTLPYWDPAFIAPDSWDDDDTVLEARSANWAIDRVTHEVTISDLITAEDDVLEFGPDQYHYDNMQVTLSGAPLRAVQVTATMPWELYAAGGFDFTPEMRMGFGAPSGLISSFTFEGLSSDWPKQGAKLGDGWTVNEGSQLVNVAFQNVGESPIPYYYDASTIPGPVAVGSLLYPSRITSGTYYGGIDGAGYDFNYQMVIVPIGYGIPVLGASYEAERDMAQVVTFTMRTDVQDVLTLAPESDVKAVKLSSNPLSDVGYNGEIPIGDSRNRDYIHSGRGQLTMQHLVLLARANLVAATRVVQTTFETDYFSGMGATMRKGAFIENPRIPGGTVAGKIKSYNLSLDGSSGAALASIVIASSVGRGGAYESSAGEPIYVDEEYSVPEYQEYKNEVTLVGTGDIAYTMPPTSTFDDGIDFKTFSKYDALREFVVVNKAEEQRARLLQSVGAEQAEVSAILETIPTQATIKLREMSGGPFIGNVVVDVADLVIPMQIDLESAT